jgi:hypothetical protein
MACVQVRRLVEERGVRPDQPEREDRLHGEDAIQPERSQNSAAVSVGRIASRTTVDHLEACGFAL